jgi:hypothetical protein
MTSVCGGGGASVTTISPGGGAGTRSRTTTRRSTQPAARRMSAVIIAGIFDRCSLLIICVRKMYVARSPRRNASPVVAPFAFPFAALVAWPRSSGRVLPDGI